MDIKALESATADAHDALAEATRMLAAARPSNGTEALEARVTELRADLIRTRADARANGGGGEQAEQIQAELARAVQDVEVEGEVEAELQRRLREQLFPRLDAADTALLAAKRAAFAAAPPVEALLEEARAAMLPIVQRAAMMRVLSLGILGELPSGLSALLCLGSEIGLDVEDLGSADESVAVGEAQAVREELVAVRSAVSNAMRPAPRIETRPPAARTAQ